MSSKRKDWFSEAVVGVFMIAVFALLVYFTVIISGVDVLKGRSRVIASVEFSAVGGLKDHDNVMYRGMKVGQVDRILLSPTNIIVKVLIDRSVVLREGYRISVCNLSMLGGNYMLMEEGLGNELDVANVLFKGETPSDWMRDVSDIARNINEFTSGGELKSIVTNLEATSIKVRTMVERVERGEGTVGQLLSSDNGLYNDLRGTMTNINVITARLRNGEGTLGRLLSGDDTLYTDLQRTFANAASVSDKVNDEKLIEDIKGGVASFRTACDSLDAKETVASANRLLESLNAVADRLKNGEGTIGKLTADQKMYDEVDGLIRDMRQVLDNYRDTTPISTFGSLIMGGL